MSSVDQPAEIEPTRPLLRDWFWRPWYAKFWLAAAACLWIAPLTPLPRDWVTDTGVWGLLMITVGNIYLIVPGLGFGYFKRAWIYKWGHPVKVSDEAWRRRESNYGDINDPTKPAYYSYMRHRR